MATEHQMKSRSKLKEQSIPDGANLRQYLSLDRQTPAFVSLTES